VCFVFVIHDTGFFDLASDIFGENGKELADLLIDTMRE